MSQRTDPLLAASDAPSSRGRRYARGAIATAIVGAAVAGAVAPACSNPVVDAQIEALGGEQDGVPQGPFHRPGQPCVLCHSPYYGAPEFAVGGTVFADQKGESFKTVDNVEVVLTDSIGETRTLTTNCIGNFYVRKQDWDPQFPLAAEIRYPVYDPNTGEAMLDSEGQVVRKVKAMGSYISRDGSCAHCHTLYGHGPTKSPTGDILYYGSAGWIYCNASGDKDTPPDTNFFPEVSATCGGKPPNDGSQTTSSSTGMP
ncbi:MAG: hypothetical protein U0414_42360 [Polyangiaceae bacterium]